jgi:hypothetical protein
VLSHVSTTDDNAASNSISNKDVYMQMQRNIAYKQAVSTASVYMHTVLMTHLLVLDSKAHSMKIRSLHRGYPYHIQKG